MKQSVIERLNANLDALDHTTLPAMSNYDRYRAICRWAAERYRRPDGLLVLDTGGVPSTYRRIDNAAAVKYLGCDPRKLGVQS